MDNRTTPLGDVSLHRCANRKEVIVYLTDCLTSRTTLPKLIIQDLYLPENAVGFSLLNDIPMLLGNVPLLFASHSNRCRTDLMSSHFNK